MIQSVTRRIRLGLGTAAALATLATSTPARADYPLVSHRYLADPGSLVYQGRIYLYNSNDDDNPVAGGYEMKSIVCVSSADLKNWTDHGVVFQVPADASWAGHSWAPQPVERDGTIFLYFGNNANGIGVASSTDPVGRFKDAKGSVLVNGSTPGASGTDIWLFDPGVLIDDDGKAYLAFGGNGESNARIIALGSDLESVSGSAAQFSPPGFYEASFLFKRNDIYYYAYSTNSANGLRIDYLTSESPMSGYTYGGVVADQPPDNDNNNHASEFVFEGKWYHAYHNRHVAKQAGIDPGYRRSLAIETLDFNADGSIKEVTYTTDGVPQVGRLNPYVRVEAETTNAQSGIETEPCEAGGMNVTSIANGDWIRVRGVDFGTAGAKSFTARVASTMAGGSIELRLDTVTGMLVGTCAVPSTGGAQAWMDATCDVTGATGVKDLYLKFTGGSFNFDYWQFTSVDGSSGGVGGAAGMGGFSGGGAGGGGAGLGGAVGGGGSAGNGAGSGGVANSAGGSAGSAGSGMVPSSGGSAGAGGSSAGGRGGSAGAGANGGNAGASAAGRSSGSGGMASGTAGAGSGASTGSAADDGGCGCRLGAARPGPAAPLGLILASLLALRRRRRSVVD